MVSGAVTIAMLVTACSSAAVTPNPTVSAPSATAAAPNPTAVPATAVLPSAAPPTAVPETAAPPTEAPPTAVPETASPPTAGPIGGGGNLVIATEKEPDNTNPTEFFTASLQLAVAKNIFQGLVGLDPSTNTLVPELALSWTNPEPTKWVFELRQGVTFHDGSTFDAAAAAISLNQQYQPANSTGFVGSPATFKAVGNYTLEMDTEAPDPVVPFRMTMTPVASAKQITEDPKSQSSHPIGTGLYQFVSWQRGSEIDLKLYPNSWQAAPGQFDTIQWLFRAEPSVRAQMIQTGEADITNHLGADQCGGGITCFAQASSDIWILRPDSYNQPFLGDVRVRKAIAMGIDRESMVQALLGRSTADNLSPAGGVGYDPNIVGYKYDLPAAQALLAEAAADGIDITQKVEVRYDTADVGEFAIMAPVVVSDLQTLGLNATLHPLSDDAASVPGQYEWANPGDQKTMLPKNRNQIWMIGYGNELMDGSVWRYVLACENDSYGYASMYCNPAVDKALDAAALLSDDARDAAYKAAWRTAYDDVAVLPLAQGGINWAFSSKITTPPAISIQSAPALWQLGK
jgi:peptide/nickel transport system substrate-binding protein